MSSVVAAKHQVELFEIGTKMSHAGMPADFVASAVRCAMDFEGVYDLMILWRDEKDKQECQESRPNGIHREYIGRRF